MKKRLGDPFLRLHLRPSRPLRSGDLPPAAAESVPFGVQFPHSSGNGYGLCPPSKKCGPLK
jgi:hypothetical protein